jgi:hypothetical protein
MTKRPGDNTPEPPGGRAAERLKMFEDARKPAADPASQSTCDQPPVPSPKTKPHRKRKR